MYSDEYSPKSMRVFSLQQKVYDTRENSNASPSEDTFYLYAKLRSYMSLYRAMYMKKKNNGYSYKSEITLDLFVFSSTLPDKLVLKNYVYLYIG